MLRIFLLLIFLAFPAFSQEIFSPGQPGNADGIGGAGGVAISPGLGDGGKGGDVGETGHPGALGIIFNTAKTNVTVIYDEASGEPRMVVTDAQDLSDPAWNPPGTKQKPIPVDTYNKFSGPKELSDYFIKEKAKQ